MIIGKIYSVTSLPLLATLYNCQGVGVT